MVAGGLTVGADGPVTVTGAVTAAGPLALAAPAITVRGALRAAAVELASTGIINVAAGGALTAGRVELAGRVVFNTGRIDADGPGGGQVVVRADNVLDGGHISADGTVGDGGTVRVGFTGSYIATAAAVTSANGGRAGQGGRLTVDGGATGRLFSSGTQQAAAAGRGGDVALLGKDVILAGATVDAAGAAVHAPSVVVTPATTLRAQAGAVSARGRPSEAPGSLPQDNLIDPHPTPAGGPGTAFTVLSNGNIVVTKPQDDFTAPSAGAVYLFHGRTGALLGCLVGDSANDRVGGGDVTTDRHGAAPDSRLGGEEEDGVDAPGVVLVGGVVALSNGNYVVASPDWTRPGGIVGAGAATWVNGMTGRTIDGSGIISAANSLVGFHPGDHVGSSVTALSNGNYVVASPEWARGGIVDAGAATWGDGFNGTTKGFVDAITNKSLVGSLPNDFVGTGVTALANGNYVVASPNWHNGPLFPNAGAATWVNGMTGQTIDGSDIISAANSLVGNLPGDFVGSGITALANGNYVVGSPNWGFFAPGAATWVNGMTGQTIDGSSSISAANSLVGHPFVTDRVGSGITALANGNYVVGSPGWENTAGAATWGNGTGGTVGVVEASNSLHGSTFGDFVGRSVTALSNGNYVVPSPNWRNVAAAMAGAATWGDGFNGTTKGAVSASNSLVGSQPGDSVGLLGVTALSNGNYVVPSPNWTTGPDLHIPRVGAATWGDGFNGTTKGAVSASNSLVGSHLGDEVGSGGVTALSNGNYVVLTQDWDGFRGAATWGDGTAGVTGAVAATNSLVGTSANDRVGAGVAALANGNYVVASPAWANGPMVPNAGAATWVNGTTGQTLDGNSTISEVNSLVGSNPGDQVGGVTPLSNGNYVVRSPEWNGGLTNGLGAATWGDGFNGTTKGPVTDQNSLVGSTPGDRVGYDVTALNNGNYVVRSPFWDNANLGISDAGAATWGDGFNGTTTGPVTDQNSLVGSHPGDHVSSNGVTALTNGNYVVASPDWANGPMVPNAGAATWGDGFNGTTHGLVDASNSLVGSNPGDRVAEGSEASGLAGVTALRNGNYVVYSPHWDSDFGAATWGDGFNGTTKGAVSASNSLVGFG
jgi:hypothetical protein